MEVPGFRFIPSDEELVTYLTEKVQGGGEARSDRIVLGECDMYGDKDPWNIWNDHGGFKIKAGEDLYLFTKLKKVSLNGSRNHKRRVGSGTWSGAYGVDVAGGLAKKKHFSYENKGCSEHHGEWIMHEYSLVADWADYVLCRLRRKINKNIKKNTKLIASTQTKNIPHVNDQENHQEIVTKKQRVGVESNHQDLTILNHLNHVEDQQYNLSSNINNNENIIHYPTPSLDDVCDFGECFNSVYDQQSESVDFGHAGVLEFGDDVNIDFGFLFDCDEQDLKEISQKEYTNVAAAAAAAKSSPSSTYDHMEVVEEHSSYANINNVAQPTSGADCNEQDLKEISREQYINVVATAAVKSSPSSTYDHMEVAEEHSSYANINNVAEPTSGAACDLQDLKGISPEDQFINVAAAFAKTSTSSTYDHMEVAKEHSSYANNNVANSTSEAAHLSQLDVDYGVVIEEDDNEYSFAQLLKDISFYYDKEHDHHDDV
ncbi:hypothetical protein FNV43_RR25537 [Rhamnella rubrinervis]|uniref:NAC domain-containing protein n=1 Tax=Rhamnella rubrinervis TaxID=2594499 RepID=A0A8K0DUR9_9ROSA|nr:hypothetical protein FNV43_RR25537 [Rhamnella rubrinervis]